MDFYAAQSTMWAGLVDEEGTSFALRFAGWRRDALSAGLQPMLVYTDEQGRFTEIGGAPDADIWLADTYEAAIWAAENGQPAELYTP